MVTAGTIGNKIAAARKLQNLSQAELAQLLAVSAQAVGKWERGESLPDFLMLHRLAAVFGVDLNYFGEGFASAPPPACAQAEAGEEAPPAHSGWDMSGERWTDADFSGLRGLADKFSRANVERCRFVDAELAGLVWRGNNIVGCDFSRADLSGCRVVGTNFVGNTFAGCRFAGAELSSGNLKNCDFTDADFTGATMRFCHLRNLTLSGVTFQGTLLRMNQFTDLTFGGAITDCRFEGGDFTRVAFEGVTFRNTFIKSCKLKRARFTDCRADRLSLAFLKANKADLSGVEVVEE